MTINDNEYNSFINKTVLRSEEKQEKQLCNEK